MASVQTAKTPGEIALEDYRATKSRRKQALKLARQSKTAAPVAPGDVWHGNRYHQRERKRRNVYLCWHLRQQGFTHDEIASEIGLTKNYVQMLLRKLAERETAHIRNCMDRLRGEQTAQLEHWVSQLVQGWERSKLPAETEKQSGSAASVIAVQIGKGKAPSKRSKKLAAALGDVTLDRTVKGQCGDPAYLQVAASLLRDIRDIWGLDAPKQSTSNTSESIRVSVEYVEPAPPAIDVTPPALPPAED